MNQTDRKLKSEINSDKEKLNITMKIWYASKTLKKFLNPDFFEKEFDDCTDILYYWDDEKMKQELYFLSREELTTFSSIKNLFFVVTFYVKWFEEYLTLSKTFSFFDVKKKWVEIKKLLKQKDRELKELEKSIKEEELKNKELQEKGKS